MAGNILAHAKDFEGGVTIEKVKKGRKCIGLKVVYVSPKRYVDETMLRFYRDRAKEYCGAHLLKFFGVEEISKKGFVNLLKRRNSLVALIASRKFGKNSPKAKRIRKAAKFLNATFDEWVKEGGSRKVNWEKLMKILFPRRK
jgi:hypothetical protein